MKSSIFPLCIIFKKLLFACLPARLSPCLPNHYSYKRLANRLCYFFMLQTFQPFSNRMNRKEKNKHLQCSTRQRIFFSRAWNSAFLGQSKNRSRNGAAKNECNDGNGDDDDGNGQLLMFKTFL